jgi:ribosomal protein S18 acetylase RimI-like enzyme
MIIEQYTQDVTDDLLELALIADPNPKVVSKYLSEAKIIVARDSGTIVGIGAIVLDGIRAELQNLSVAKPHRGKGIAKLIIADILELSKFSGVKILNVGTGNSSLNQLSLYQKCGFRMDGIIPNYYANYPEPIYENGIRCIDMVRLYIKL